MRDLSKLRVIAKNSDWFIALFVPVVIGRNNYFVLLLDSHLKTSLGYYSQQGPVSRKSRELFGSEKPVVNLQSACFENLIF